MPSDHTAASSSRARANGISISGAGRGVPVTAAYAIRATSLGLTAPGAPGALALAALALAARPASTIRSHSRGPRQVSSMSAQSQPRTVGGRLPPWASPCSTISGLSLLSRPASSARTGPRDLMRSELWPATSLIRPLPDGVRILMQKPGARLVLRDRVMTAARQYHSPVGKLQPLGWLKVVTDQVAVRAPALSGQLPPDPVIRQPVSVTWQQHRRVHPIVADLDPRNHVPRLRGL